MTDYTRRARRPRERRDHLLHPPHLQPPPQYTSVMRIGVLVSGRVQRITAAESPIGSHKRQSASNL